MSRRGGWRSAWPSCSSSPLPRPWASGARAAPAAMRSPACRRSSRAPRSSTPPAAREQPDEDRDKVVDSLGTAPPPFGPVVGAVGYHYEQWAQISAYAQGIGIRTRDNPDFTMLDDHALKPLWSVQVDTEPLGVRREHRHLPRRHDAEGGRTRPGRAERPHGGPPVVRLARRAARARRRTRSRRSCSTTAASWCWDPARTDASASSGWTATARRSGPRRCGRRRVTTWAWSATGCWWQGVVRRTSSPTRRRCTRARAASWPWTSTPDGRPGGRPSCWAPART